MVAPDFALRTCHGKDVGLENQSVKCVALTINQQAAVHLFIIAKVIIIETSSFALVVLSCGLDVFDLRGD
uniref:Uncharacterized protein n=1 Tax=Romanomermis culicivorax TaxID=13658 RepID=A0A915I7C5_ROMCU